MRKDRWLEMVAAFVSGGAAAMAGETTCVSTDGAGHLVDLPGCVVGSCVDASGNLVFFSSSADDFVAGDTNGFLDVYMKDLSTGAISRVVLGIGGAEPDESSFEVDCTPDGRFVAFCSRATNLVSGDTNLCDDVFVLDRSSGSIACVSVAANGNPANAPCHFPSISDDGRFVAYVSDADNLWKGDTVGTGDVFVYDRTSKKIDCASVDTQGFPGTGDCLRSGITGDGAFVFFDSTSAQIVTHDVNGVRDCFLRDLAADTTTRVSLAPDGSELDGFGNYGVAFTDDKEWIAFTSSATNLLPGFSSLYEQVFLLNLVDGRVFLVSRSSSGEAGDSTSYAGRIAYLTTAAGVEPVVSFNSWADNLGAGRGANAFLEPWANRPFLGITQCLDVASDGSAGDGLWASSGDPILAADASFALICTESGNLVANDTNLDYDLMRRELVWTTFEESGVGIAGSGGFVPHLFGFGGAVETGFWSIHLEDALGGAPGLLWVGVGSTDLPAFGGHFYVDLSLPHLALPIVAGGGAGVAGDGSFALTGADVSAFVPFTIYLQAMLADAAAPRHLTLSNALALHIGG